VVVDGLFGGGPGVGLPDVVGGVQRRRRAWRWREALTATKLYAALMGGFVFFSLAGFFLTQSGFTLSVTLTNGFESSLTGASLTS